MAGKKGARRARSAALDEWAVRYAAGESALAIAKSAGVTRMAVAHALRRRNVVMRSFVESRHRVYGCVDTFFNTIDTEAKAYWLGFIAADGNVYKNTLAFGLAARDQGHLERFLNAIEGNYAITRRPNSLGMDSVWLKVNSVRFVDALAKHGIGPRKSLTLAWPNVPTDMERHFLRGYIDGDGSWHWGPSRVGRPTWSISVVGAETFLRKAMDCLVYGCAVRRVTIADASKASRGVKRFSYGGNRQIARIAHYLYDGATVYLPRKKERADEAITESLRPRAT